MHAAGASRQPRLHRKRHPFWGRTYYVTGSLLQHIHHSCHLGLDFGYQLPDSKTRGCREERPDNDGHTASVPQPLAKVGMVPASLECCLLGVGVAGVAVIQGLAVVCTQRTCGRKRSRLVSRQGAHDGATNKKTVCGCFKQMVASHESIMLSPGFLGVILLCMALNAAVPPACEWQRLCSADTAQHVVYTSLARMYLQKLVRL